MRNGISANCFVTEAGNALLHLVISMKVTVIFSNPKQHHLSSVGTDNERESTAWFRGVKDEECDHPSLTFNRANIAGSRRVLATAVDNWLGKPYCVSSYYKLTPTYNNERRPKSHPNELALTPFIFPKGIKRIGTHRSKDRVFCLSPEIIYPLHAHCFFDRA